MTKADLVERVTAQISRTAGPTISKKDCARVVDAFLDAIVTNAAIGGSTNAQQHIIAMARHAGVELRLDDWMEYGHDVPLLLNMQPSGKYLGERFHRAGGVPAGRERPPKETSETPGTPASARVGTSGSRGLRVGAVTASAFNLPPAMWGSETDVMVSAKSTCLPRTAFADSEAPL